MLERVVIDAVLREPHPSHLRAWIAREFPTVHVRVGDCDESIDARLETQDWERDSFDFWRFDRQLDELSAHPFTLGIRGPGRDAWKTAAEVLTRAQRTIGRRNRQSEGATFGELLARHRSLHDLTKPLVIADYAHALDVWQWTLRLEREASAAVQIAALYHDIERLQSEADARIEAAAEDYRAFKGDHARTGARIVHHHLSEAGIDASTASRVAKLVEGHEHARSSSDAMLLADADALSFFSLNSSGFLDYFGEAHTKKKILYSLARLGKEARTMLPTLRLRAEVNELLRRCEEEMGS